MKPLTPTQIKNIRLSLDMTQGNFANALHTTISTVSRWENGKVKPSPYFVAGMNKLGEYHV